MTEKNVCENIHQVFRVVPSESSTWKRGKLIIYLAHFQIVSFVFTGSGCYFSFRKEI